MATQTSEPSFKQASQNTYLSLRVEWINKWITKMSFKNELKGLLTFPSSYVVFVGEGASPCPTGSLSEVWLEKEDSNL